MNEVRRRCEKREVFQSDFDSNVLLELREIRNVLKTIEDRENDQNEIIASIRAAMNPELRLNPCEDVDESNQNIDKNVCYY